MSLSLYDVSVPSYVRMLNNLVAFLEKAETYAREKGLDLGAFAEARLAPEMYPLTRQVQTASDAAKGGAARLAGVAAPSMPDTETTFAELKARVAKTIAYLESLKREQFDGDDGRTIEMKFPGRTVNFTARDFVLQFSLPNFMFHVVTAYDILRSQGVPLGKMDFLAGAQMQVAA